MSPRSKVGALLIGLMLFMTAASAAAYYVRGRAADALQRVAQQDVPLLTLATDVTAAHLEQELALERARRDARASETDPAARRRYDAARADYEHHASQIWKRLQQALAVAENTASRSDDPAARTTYERIRSIDALHDGYAARVRNAFGLLDQQRLTEAAAAAESAEQQVAKLERALGALLVDIGKSTEAASAEARRDERIASFVVLLLFGTAFALAPAIFVVVWHLVSEMRSLRGLLPICAHCKKIRDDRGYWNQLEAYVESNSEAAFTHGICEDCKDDLLAQLSSRELSGAVPAR